MKKVLYLVWTLGFFGLIYLIRTVEVAIMTYQQENYKFSPHIYTALALYGLLGAYLATIFIRKPFSVNWAFLGLTFAPVLVFYTFLILTKYAFFVNAQYVGLFCGFTLLTGLFYRQK